MYDGSRFSYTALVRQIKRLCLAQERVIARGFEGMPKEKFLKLHALRLNLTEFSKIYIGVILTLAMHILYLFIFNYISTSVKTGSRLLTQMTC